MRKFLLLILAAVMMTTPVCAVRDDYVEDRDYLARAMVSSYPDADIAVLTGIAAVVRNRCSADGYPNSAAGVVSSFGGGEFAALVIRDSEDTRDEDYAKGLRLAKDACRFAEMGADPTGGALNFCRLNDDRKFDFRFDDSAEEHLSAKNKKIIEQSRTVIGEFAFW